MLRVRLGLSSNCALVPSPMRARFHCAYLIDTLNHEEVAQVNLIQKSKTAMDNIAFTKKLVTFKRL